MKGVAEGTIYREVGKIKGTKWGTRPAIVKRPYTSRRGWQEGERLSEVSKSWSGVRRATVLSNQNSNCLIPKLVNLFIALTKSESQSPVWVWLIVSGFSTLSVSGISRVWSTKCSWGIVTNTVWVWVSFACKNQM